MKESIIKYARAGYAGLFLCTAEEIRAEAEVKAAAEELDRDLHAWSITTGMVDTNSGSIHRCTEPVEALESIELLNSDCVVVLRDFGALLEDKDPLLIRTLRDALAHAKSAGKLIVLIGIWKSLPAELEREITRIDFRLPDKGQLATVLDAITESAQLPPIGEPNRDPILEAAGGLTTMEAENAFALSVVETGDIEASIVAREKANALRSGGLLEVIDTPATLDDIGGLNALKDWLLQRREAFTQRARDYGLPIPKGMLVLGVPGTGKSLTAKATSSVFGIPLLKLDAGKLFGGLVGQSEANLRSVIQTAEAISPCVLWIDEIEKGFGGMGGSNSSTDGGTSARVFGTMLNWLQEKTKPVFVVATANDVSKLPPELLRKGRWDELWFVDLPNNQERTAIWDIVIEKYGREKTAFDSVVLARASELHTGAEIEAAFVEALHRCFTQDREPTELDLGEVLCESVPLATTMSESIEQLRHWAKTRARHATHADKPANGRRKLDLS
ncbi:AAA family ATPase [Verrucomicrobiales bacterium BCK34]|nr:AAA family ATPase [Verrucomicrobiales bacterium BCK34]